MKKKLKNREGENNMEDEYTSEETNNPILSLRQAIEMTVWISDNYLDMPNGVWSDFNGNEFSTKELVKLFLDKCGI